MPHTMLASTCTVDGDPAEMSAVTDGTGHVLGVYVTVHYGTGPYVGSHEAGPFADEIEAREWAERAMYREDYGTR